MTTITKDGNTRTVKNLGWLFKNYSKVSHLEVHGTGPGTRFTLRAVLEDGAVYQTDFQSYTVFLERFICRSIWQDVEVRFFDCAPCRFNKHNGRMTPGCQSLQVFVPGAGSLVQVYRVGYFANQYLGSDGTGRSDYALSYCGPDRVAQLANA